MMALSERFTCNFFYKEGGLNFLKIFYTTLIHLLPLIFHSVEGCWIEPRTVTTSALTVRRSNRPPRSYPRRLDLNQLDFIHPG